MSDGQREKVRVRELNALREACKKLPGDYRPSITAVMAQRGHHFRFDVVDARVGERNTGNVPPGTYIDGGVVHPENFDFFMYTHRGLLGTSRPTRYQVVYSDEEMSMDDITEIIYHLCHFYARSTTSVSIPAPVYYARLAAFRAKEHLRGNSSLTRSGCHSASSGRGVSFDLAPYQQSCNVDTRNRQFLYYV